jgi:hypothetical protein
MVCIAAGIFFCDALFVGFVQLFLRDALANPAALNAHPSKSRAAPVLQGWSREEKTGLADLGKSRAS